MCCRPDQPQFPPVDFTHEEKSACMSNGSRPNICRMPDSPLVSVVMPSYDRPYFLRHRSIPSVLRQTYANWELIVVGDGPEDDSIRSAVESFRDERIRYFEIARPKYENLNPMQFWFIAGAAARNFALDIAKGELICPLDDDDEFLPNHLEDCVRTLSGGQLDVLYGCVLHRDLEAGTEYVDFVPSTPTSSKRSPFDDIIYHSSVCYSSRMKKFRYSCEAVEPDDYGLLRTMWRSGARFGRLTKPQFVSYGGTFLTRYRLSVPSIPSFATLAGEVKSVLRSRTLTNNGPYCQRFEQAASEFLGSPMVATPSGDVALIVAFAALRLRISDATRSEVIVPSYTHPSTANALLWNGFQPVFCDVDRNTLCVTPDIIEPLLSHRVAAVLPVHAHGNPCDMPQIEKLARKYGIAVVADASAAFGAEIAGSRVGSFGDLEIFSFSGTKVLTCGEGGGIACNNPELLELARRLSRYGIGENYHCETKGINAKMAELPAMLGLTNLKQFNGLLSSRRRAAARYRSHFKDLEGIRVPRPFSPLASSSEKDLPLVFPSAKEANFVARRLESCRIDTRSYYRPLHKMQAFSKCRRGSLHNTEELSDAVVCIPLYNEIRDELLDMVAGIVCEERPRLQNSDMAA